MAADPAPLEPADLELLERLARRVVELRLEVPAILALESARPLSVIAGQALVFFQPFVTGLFALPDYERLAALLQRRDALDLLVERLEALAGARREAERGGGGARR